MSADRELDPVSKYRDTIGRAWSHGDTNVWPVKLNASLHVFATAFGEELLDDIAWLEQQGRTLAEIAKPLYNPSRVYRIIDTTIYSMRRNRYTVAEQKAVVRKLLEMAGTLKFGSVFNEDGRNIIYDPATAATIAETRCARPIASIRESQLVHRFCAMMWAYTESIFFRAHDVTKEIHGPYSSQSGSRSVIVKEYLNLRPLEIWPDVPLLPCGTIKVYKRYHDAVRIHIDALNHLYHEGGQLVPSLESCAIEVDGQPVDIEILEEFLTIVRQTIPTISSFIDSITWNDRVAKYAEIFWFRKKPIAEQRGRDWRVPAAVRQAIAQGSENERRREPMSNEASERLAMFTI